MNKRLFISVLFLLSSFFVFSQGWMGALKIESSNWIDETTLVTDYNSNVYAGIRFKTDCIIQDTIVIPAMGVSDAIIVKYNESGHLIFVKHLKSTVDVVLSRMVVDKDNNYIYVTGGFSDTLFLDTDTLIGTGDGKVDGFLMKMKFDGTVVWLERFCWGPNVDRGVDINIDDDDNVILTGMFKDSTYIGDNLGVNTDSYYWNGYKNLFYAKYDTNGHKIFSKVIVSTNNTDFINSVAISGNRYYFAGYFKNQITISGTNYLSAGGFDYLLFSTDYYGNVQFVKNFGGTADDRFNDLTIKDGCIYGVGSAASSSISVDGQTFGSHGGDDITVMKFDSTGLLKWVYITGNSLSDYASSVSATDSGLIVSGQFTDDVDFGGTVYHGESGDAFVISIDTSGIIKKFAQAYGNGTDRARRNSVDLYSLNNNRFILGDFLSDTLFIGNDSLINTYSNKVVFLAEYGCPKTNIEFITLSDIACYGDSTASIVANPLVGVSPFSYQWNTGSTSDTLTNLPSGWYKVTVTDANGCLQIDSVFVNQPAKLSAVLEVNNESCNGGDGHIDLTVSGGTPQYYYSWSTGDTTEDLNNLTNGNYLVTITDVNGCTLIDSAVVNPYDTISLVANISNESCNGADGKISVSVNGGQSPYTFNWSNGDISNVADSLTAGTYYVTVSDFNGCSRIDSFIVEPYDTMEVVFNIENETCTGNDGKITIAVNGGQSPYTYIWSNGDNTSQITDLQAGVYSVTVTDANGCSVVDSAQVMPFVDMQAAFSINNETCEGNDGVITAIVTGGTPPYSYVWANGDSTNQADSLAPGYYAVTITDHNGCQFVDSAQVLAYEPIVTYLNVTNETCNGNDGKINLVVTGGVQPYSYLWNNGDTLVYVDSLAAGVYTVTVTDANGCTKVDSAEVLTYTPIQITSEITLASCHNNDGAIDIFVAGGNQPYTYSWSNGDTIQDIDSLSTGIYYVTVTDANGCQMLDSINVGQQLPPSINLSATTINCVGDSSVQLSAQVSGDNSPYTVVWYQIVDTTVNYLDTATVVNNQYAGVYFVNVIDNNNCVFSDTIRVAAPDTIKLTFKVTPENCKNTQTGAVELTVTGGSSDIYFYDWSNGATTKDLENISTGTYYVTVTDLNNCSVSDSVYVPLTENDCNVDLVIYNIITPNNDGQNDVWTIGNIENYPEVHIDIYNEWGNLVYSTDGYDEPWDATDNNGKKVAAGTYYYIIKLGNGVTYSGYLTVMY